MPASTPTNSDTPSIVPIFKHVTYARLRLLIADAILYVNRKRSRWPAEPRKTVCASPTTRFFPSDRRPPPFHLGETGLTDRRERCHNKPLRHAARWCVGHKFALTHTILYSAHVIIHRDFQLVSIFTPYIPLTFIYRKT